MRTRTDILLSMAADARPCQLWIAPLLLGLMAACSAEPESYAGETGGAEPNDELFHVEPKALVDEELNAISELPVAVQLEPDSPEEEEEEEAAPRSHATFDHLTNMMPNVPVRTKAFAGLLSNGDPDTSLRAISASNEWADVYGMSTAVGDFDGDGVDDLVVGAPFETVYGDRAAGVFFEYQGENGELVGRRWWRQPIGQPQEFEHFGWTFAVGDFNADGKDDLAVGAPYDYRSALGTSDGPFLRSGAVLVYYGTSEGLRYNQVLDHQSWRSWKGRGDRFGWALAAGDVDGDGRDDLAIGAPGDVDSSGVQAGQVFVARSEGDALVGWKVVDQTALSTSNAGERFGASVAIGPSLFTGGACPSCETLAVGCFNNYTGTRRSGAVFLFEGDGSELVAGQRVQQRGWNEDGDDFGWAVAIANVSGTTQPDLIVGAPGENRDRGYVYVYEDVYESTNAGVSTLSSKGSAHGAQKFGLGIGARFGASLATGRINADELNDVLVGAPGTPVDGEVGSNGGSVGILYGNWPSDLADGPTLYDVSGSNADGDQLGRSVAIGDFGAAAQGETVVMSAPYDAASGVPGVGRVHLRGWVETPSGDFLAESTVLQQSP